jgi:hypothetical protein
LATEQKIKERDKTILKIEKEKALLQLEISSLKGRTGRYDQIKSDRDRMINPN